MVWQEKPARSFDWAHALRPAYHAYNGTIASLPLLLNSICLSRFAILEKATIEILPSSVITIEFKFSMIFQGSSSLQ
ncbi:MAG TPA: hypothetical protein DCS60_01550 [Opitutae bacterium]|nr:hypothetical protein [Opitutae bacterium]